MQRNAAAKRSRASCAAPSRQVESAGIGFGGKRLASRLLVVLPVCFKRFGHLLGSRSKPSGLSSLKIVRHFPDLAGRSETDVGSLASHRVKQGLLMAEADFREAIALAQKMVTTAWELRATTILARLLAKQDRRDEARQMLSDIYGWFTEGFETRDLKDAKALLDELNE